MGSEQEFELVMGHEFHDRRLLEVVLTHSSLLNEPAGANRRANTQLAHLGDAVVGLAVRAYLYHRNPNADKGTLTVLAQGLVSDIALAKVAGKIGIGPFLARGASRRPSEDNHTVLAELFEAAIGAIFLDSNFEQAAEVVGKHLGLADNGNH